MFGSGSRSASDDTTFPRSSECLRTLNHILRQFYWLQRLGFICTSCRSFKYLSRVEITKVTREPETNEHNKIIETELEPFSAGSVDQFCLFSRPSPSDTPTSCQLPANSSVSITQHKPVHYIQEVMRLHRQEARSAASASWMLMLVIGSELDILFEMKCTSCPGRVNFLMTSCQLTHPASSLIFINRLFLYVHIKLYFFSCTCCFTVMMLFISNINAFLFDVLLSVCLSALIRRYTCDVFRCQTACCLFLFARESVFTFSS